MKILLLLAISCLSTMIDPVYESVERHETEETREQRENISEKSDDYNLGIRCDTAGTRC